MAYSCHSGKHFVHVLDLKVLHCKHTVMHLSKLSRWGGGIGGGFHVTSLPVVGTFDHSLSSFDHQ